MSLSLRKRRSNPLLISGVPVLTGQENDTIISWQATASGGTPPYTYSKTGTWPTNIVVNSSTGVVSGTFTQNGSFATLSVRVTDSLSATKSLSTFTMVVDPPPAATFVVADQSAGFGALTKSAAGGYQIVANRAIEACSITSGNGSLHWQVTNTGIITPTAAGDTADLNAGPYSLVVSCTSGVSNTDTATISITPEANVFDFASGTELAAIETLGATAVSGKTAKGRPVAVTLSAAIQVNIQPASTFTITSRDTANPFTMTTGAATRAFDITAAARITVSYLRIKQVGGVFRTIQIRNASNLITFDHNTVEHVPFDHTVVQSPPPNTGIAFGADGSTASTNISITNNHVRWFYDGILMGHTIHGNVVEYCLRDFCKPSTNSGSFSVKWNFFRCPTEGADSTHQDFCQLNDNAPVVTAEIWGNILFRGEGSASAQGPFAPGSLGNNTISYKGNILISEHAIGITLEKAINCTAIGNTIISAEGINTPRITLGGTSDGGGHTVKYNVACATGTNFTAVNNTILAYANYSAAFNMTGVVTNLRGIGNGSNLLAARDEILAAVGLKANGTLDKDNSGTGTAGDHGATSGYVTWPTTVPGSDGSLNAAFEA